MQQIVLNTRHLPRTIRAFSHTKANAAVSGNASTGSVLSADSIRTVAAAVSCLSSIPGTAAMQSVCRSMLIAKDDGEQLLVERCLPLPMLLRMWRVQ